MKDKPVVKVLAVVLSILALFLVWRNILSRRIKKPSKVARMVETVKQIAKQEILPVLKGEKGVENLINTQALLRPAYEFLPEKAVQLRLMSELKYNPFRTNVFLPSGKTGEYAVKLRLDAIIIIKGGKKYAIINGKKYTEGEMAGPALIKSIEGNKVLLQTPQGEDFLELYTDKREIEIYLPSTQGEKK